MDSELEGYIDIEEDVRSSLPIIIVTGEIDVYREPCECARRIFTAAGHPVRFQLLANTPHLYQPCCEKEVCDFFLECVLPPEICGLWSAAAKLRCCSIDQAISLAHLSSQLHRHPSLFAELCTTDLVACLLQLLPRASGEVAMCTLHILMTLNATTSVELKGHPGICRYLWGIVDNIHSDDNVREAAAEFLFTCSTK